LVTLGSNVPIRIREIKPKDFYLAQIIRGREGSFMPLVTRLVQNKEVINGLPVKDFKQFINWVVDNMLNESVLTVENWMEVSFHLCKQRWDSSMDWLEDQPMSKIRAMIDITEKYVEEQNDQIKRG
jgi:hypothetical protein